MILIIAEKPSVARDIAAVVGATRKGSGCLEGGQYVVTWCVGHLAQLANPKAYNSDWEKWSKESLPMIPVRFRLVGRGARGQLKHVCVLLKSSRFHAVINACDAGREGEAIFRNVYAYAKSKLPMKRLWLQSLTPAAIKEGLRTLTPGSDYDDLADAAQSRAEADWLVGLNATRAYTLVAQGAGSKELYTLGRVQTPTLAMIVARDRAIGDFKSVPFWEVYTTFEALCGTPFEALLHRPESYLLHPTRFDSRQAAEVAVASFMAPTGLVSDVKTTHKATAPPALYDLTRLQRAANQRFGFTAKQTLDIAQSLYEKHKVLSYPRTDSSYLPTTMKDVMPDVLEALDFGPYAETLKFIRMKNLRCPKAIINNKKVSDHHAIIPTSEDASQKGLNSNERKIYDLVARRLLGTYLGKRVRRHTEVTIVMNDSRLVATGVRTLEQGFFSIDPAKSVGKETQLPPVEKDHELSRIDNRLHKGETKPPKAFNDSSLLRAMETAGKSEEEMEHATKLYALGTPATRASIIETLVSRAYVERNGRSILATPKGVHLIEHLPTKTLTSAELTGRWEHGLDRIAKGTLERQVFMASARELTTSLCEQIMTIELPKVEAPALGQCPLCNTAITANRHGYFCQSGRDCTFAIFSPMAGKKLPQKAIKLLLKGGTTPPIKGFKSKKGKSFSAALRLNATGRVDFVFEKARGIAS